MLSDSSKVCYCVLINNAIACALKISFSWKVGENIVHHLKDSKIKVILNLILADGTDELVIQQIKVNLLMYSIQ